VGNLPQLAGSVNPSYPLVSLYGMGNDDSWEPLREQQIRQFWVAGGTIAAIVALAVWSIWPFQEAPPSLGQEPSVWEVLLHDQWVLGFLRSGIVVVVVYVIVSVPALIVAGRWMKGLGTAGVTADDAERADAHRTIELLLRKVESSHGAGDGPD
jgi:hypothetical protein